MPERDKDVVKTLIDAFITKGKLKQLVLITKKPGSAGLLCYQSIILHTCINTIA